MEQLEKIKTLALSKEQIEEKYHDFIYGTIDDKSSCLFDFYDGYLCYKCNGKLDEQGKCDKCGINYSKRNRIRLSDGYLTQFKGVFEVIDDNLFFYGITIDKGYYKDMEDYNKYNIYINRFYINQDGFVDIDIDTEDYTFETYKEYLDSTETDMDEEKSKLYDRYYDIFNLQIDELYMNNIEELDNCSILKHSCVSDIIKYIVDKRKVIDFKETVIYSIMYKEREYLYKLGFKKLAAFFPGDIKYNKDFKNTFGVDKSYYQFMKNNDIDYITLLGLRAHPTNDLRIVKLMGEIQHRRYYDELELFKTIGLKKVSRYLFDEQGNMIRRTFIYADYIRMAYQEGLNIINKRIAFPENLTQAHDELVEKYDPDRYKDANSRIKTIGEKCMVNKYEDDNYIIIPALSRDDLENESKQMHNCVRTYVGSILDGSCQIYFMREKANPDKSLVTIEVRDNKVVQAKIKCNKDVPDNLMLIINEFERRLKLID